eukprot:349887_1
MHEIVLGTEYKNELICKHFQQQYNIVRNEPMDLRHILALIFYTDITAFCRVFRSTYRKIDNESNQEVKNRHEELYFYSRYLFESIEFFGVRMPKDAKVYHGLNRVLYFQKFSTYFNQPISTTDNLITASEFAQGGMILTLTAATQYISDETKIPKYLAVSFLSDFPHENEKLFYGSSVVFKVCNIYTVEGKKFVGHSEELALFNKFEKLLQNQHVLWNLNDKKEQNQIHALVTLIRQYRSNEVQDNISEQKEQQHELSSQYGTKFGESLFRYFVNHHKKISIKNYKSFPTQLYDALFVDNKSPQLSLIHITKLFKNAKTIVFCELDLEQMVIESHDYVDTILDYIKNAVNTSEETLDMITFKTKQQRSFKQNSTLQILMKQFSESCLTYGWESEYDFDVENIHNLRFICKYKQKPFQVKISHTLLMSLFVQELTELVRLAANKIFEDETVAQIIYDTIEQYEDADEILDDLTSHHNSHLIQAVSNSIQSNEGINYFWDNPQKNSLLQMLTKIYEDNITDLTKFAPISSASSLTSQLATVPESDKLNEFRIDILKIVHELNQTLRKPINIDDVIQLFTQDPELTDELISDISTKIFCDKAEKYNIKQVYSQRIITAIQRAYQGKQIDGINNKILNKHKGKIMEYFKKNNIDRNTLKNIERKEFIDNICKYCDDKQLRAPSAKLYNVMTTIIDTFADQLSKQIDDIDKQLLNEYKAKIMQYVKENKMDYNKFIDMERKEFMFNIRAYCEEKKK